RDYGISSLVLMEQAGRESARLLDQLHRTVDPRHVVILCGKGNNGGDGLVMARHLEQLQYRVEVVLGHPDALLSTDTAANLQRLTENQQSGLTLHRLETTRENLAGLEQHLEGACWYVDALLGTGSQGNPRPPSDDAIRWLNQKPARRVALDIPSGLDCDSGEIGTPCLEAEQTFTFVAAKPGLLLPASQPLVGTLHVIDIGIPPELLSAILAGSTS
ncbi:MAG: NAD(P)H-hydrate epimerase, partial [Pirellulaceae bacterium]